MPGLDRLRALYPWPLRGAALSGNIVVVTEPDVEGFVENDWVDTLDPGDEVRLRITGSCPRRVMTTLRQGDLPQDSGILRRAEQHNQVAVRVYADETGEQSGLAPPPQRAPGPAPCLLPDGRLRNRPYARRLRHKGDRGPANDKPPTRAQPVDGRGRARRPAVRPVRTTAHQNDPAQPPDAAETATPEPT